METLLVVDDPATWPLSVPGLEMMAARTYLTTPEAFAGRRVRVINLCRSHRYQSTGYYVSLLAAARGHRPLPSVSVMQDLKASEIARIAVGDVGELVEKSLKDIRSDEFVLSVYFGKNVAQRHERLAARLFGLVEAPLMRARFRRAAQNGGKLAPGESWQLVSLRPLNVDDIPDDHHDFVVDALASYIARRPRAKEAKPSRYDLAVLVDPDEHEPPSDKVFLTKLERIARSAGVAIDRITRADYSLLATYDALFIRTTTNVNHYSYRFARRAAAEGMAVIDDPMSILRCTNKVYLAELLARHRIPSPRTVVLHRGNVAEAVERLGMPCVLKSPDGAFSRGVIKVETDEELAVAADQMLTRSELIIGQRFMPTAFDWRIGVLDNKPLWACRYHMARHHWQIATGEGTRRRYGRVETVPVEDVPDVVIKTSLRAAALIGDGLYGVDLKEIDDRALVIEINDNPTLEAGEEDAISGDALYQAIVSSFIRRIENVA
jgi:glutathione synthase/RimK-type ligase-like ATP-grasp enzyme